MCLLQQKSSAPYTDTKAGGLPIYFKVIFYGDKQAGIQREVASFQAPGEAADILGSPGTSSDTLTK